MADWLARYRRAVNAAHSDVLDIVLDRNAEVPIGVQLTWALRTRIRGGVLAPGHRLPGLHRLAEDIGVNANTIRAVYLRLEQEGLVETRHGSGTFVAAAPQDRGTLTQLVSGAAHAARDAGIDPRDVAAALYVGADDPVAPDQETAARRRLRAQIAALEQALSDLLATRPDLAPKAASEPRESRPRLLNAAELEDQRASLLRRLAETQAAVDAPPEEDEPRPATTKPGRSPAAAAKKLRVAPRPS